ncbi:MAG TPA: hypothetical protein VIO58_03730 [Candidatus Methanoperedens sp.]
MPKDMTGELRKALFGRSSVFMGSMETPTERIVYHIIHNALLSGETVAWVCVKDSPGSIFAKFSSYELPLEKLEDRLWFVDATMMGDNPALQNTLRCISLDYVCVTMHIIEILKNHPKLLVMLDNIGIMAALGRIDTIVRFIKFVDLKIRPAGGGIVTLLSYNAIPGSAESELVSLMDTLILVEEENIRAHVGSREINIPFCFSGSELILGSGDIENDLNELFCLTVEEKKKLELEVAKKADFYKELID